MLICSIPLELRRMSDSRETPPPLFGGALQFVEDEHARAAQNSTSTSTSTSILARHALFIQCLEHHGSNLTGNEWHVMAEELGWSIQEVQLHAYQYLNHLFETDDDHHDHHPNPPVVEESSSSSPLPRTNGGKSNGHGGPPSPPRREQETQGSTSNNAPWTLEEALIFETLVVTYKTTNGDDNSSGPNPSGYTWDDMVAAHLSGRTASQVRRRYRQLYGRTTSSPGSQNNHSR
jgi:hypothetical protein